MRTNSLFSKLLIAAGFVFIAFPALFVAAAWVAGIFVPIAEVDVPIPLKDVRVHHQLRQGRWEAIVENGSGSARIKLWEEWGPADYATFYTTPDGNLVIIGGASTTIIDLNAKTSPQVMASQYWPAPASSDQWHFIGTVERTGASEMIFRPSPETPECIPLFGEGWVPYRPQYHSQGSCPRQEDAT